ncbi:MAG TPA: ECF-type sigma factor [Bryobacteraceae bacterium]
MAATAIALTGLDTLSLTVMSDDSQDVTRLIRALGGSNSESRQRLFSILYNELRRVAAHHMRGERGNHTLTPTVLVHEAWLRLSSQETVQDRHHFLGLGRAGYAPSAGRSCPRAAGSATRWRHGLRHA